MASQPSAEAPATTATAAKEVAYTDRAAETRSLQPEAIQQQIHPVDQVDPALSMVQPADETAGASAATSEQPVPTKIEPQPQAPTAPASEEEKPSHAPLTRQRTEALGPATDAEGITPPTASSTGGPALNINLMLAATGAKHPYKIDEKYLTSRQTSAKSADGTFDPKQLTGYKLKELIWIDWRKEWEGKPSSPSSIRLINMGKMIEDKKTLNDYAFDMEKTNVVHMTIRPEDFGEDEQAPGKHGGKGGSIRTRDGGEGGAGCRCVIL